MEGATFHGQVGRCVEPSAECIAPLVCMGGPGPVDVAVTPPCEKARWRISPGPSQPSAQERCASLRQQSAWVGGPAHVGVAATPIRKGGAWGVGG